MWMNPGNMMLSIRCQSEKAISWDLFVQNVQKRPFMGTEGRSEDARGWGWDEVMF